MGAGASATKGADAKSLSENSWVVNEIKDPEDNTTFLSISSPLLLMVTQESLDLTSVSSKDTTVLHYPYHQIKCWSYSASYFKFQLGVGKVQKIFKFKTTEGKVIQKILLDTILQFMAQSKEGALQTEDYETFQKLMFDGSKNLVSNWNDVAINFFNSRPYRLTAAQAMSLLEDIDLSDEFVSLDFCCMLYKFILNRESFKLVMNSLKDKQLKLNLANRLGIECSNSEGVTVKPPDGAV